MEHLAWVRIDDHFDEHPKMAQVGPLGMALWAVGLAYCNRNLTDGFIPWSAARRLLAWEFAGSPDTDGRRKRYKIAITCGMQGEDANADTVIDLLLDAGLWDEVDGGYQVHDYDQYQPTKATVEAERASARERMANARGNKKRSSDDVRANSQRSSDNPDPDPDPDPDPSTPLLSPQSPNGSSKHITEELVAVLQEKHPTLSAHRELERFRNYNEGKGRKPKSEAAAFRNWMLKAEELHQERQSGTELPACKKDDCDSPGVERGWCLAHDPMEVR